MRLKLDILKALEQAVFDSGSGNAFALKHGILQQNISRYLRDLRSGKEPVIEDATWEKLESVLRPYLPKVAAPIAQAPTAQETPLKNAIPLPDGMGRDIAADILAYYHDPVNRKHLGKLLGDIEEWKHPQPPEEQRLA